MSVAGPCNVFTAGVVFHGEGSFSDGLTSVGADDVAAENLVGVSLSEELDETILVVDGLGARVGNVGERALVCRLESV